MKREDRLNRKLIAIRHINACGLHRLKLYCTTKKYPVHDFDKEIAVLRDYLRYGARYTANKHDVPEGGISNILTKYERYAIACMRA